jgi:hypothetical protein
MAEIFGKNYALARTYPGATKASSADYKGLKRPMNDEQELAAAQIGDELLVGELSASEKVQPGSFVVHDALGAGVTLAVVLRTADGTETTVFAAEAADAAGTLEFAASQIDTFPVQAVDAAGNPAASTIIVKIAGAVANGTVKTFIEYTR